MEECAITMFQFMECFANIAPECEVTLVNCSGSPHLYHSDDITKGVNLHGTHTLPEWCMIFDKNGINFNKILVRFWAVKSFKELTLLDPMIEKLTIWIKEG